MSKKTKFIVIHGGYGSPNTDWFPKMSKILKNKGIEFKIPKLPGGLFGAFPNANKWEKVIENEFKTNFNIVVISYSLGCIAVLRLLERQKTKIKFWILVAPPSASVKNAKRWQGRARTFFDHKIKYKKAVKNVDNILVIASSNDTKAPYKGSINIAKKLSFKANLLVYKNGDHLSSPKIADYIFKNVPKKFYT